MKFRWPFKKRETVLDRPPFVPPKPDEMRGIAETIRAARPLMPTHIESRILVVSTNPNLPFTSRAKCRGLDLAIEQVVNEEAEPDASKWVFISATIAGSHVLLFFHRTTLKPAP